MTWLVVCLILVLMVIGAPIFSILLCFAAYGALQVTRGSFFEEFGGQIGASFDMGAASIMSRTLSTSPLFSLGGFLLAESKKRGLTEIPE